MNYLYNGVELAALPDWDKTTYPYAIITRDSEGIPVGGRLYISTERFVYVDGVVIRPDTASGEYYFHTRDSFGMGVWFHNPSASQVSGTPFWTNTDIYMRDDTSVLYLAASEPVPVLSIDYTAMVQGWIVGKRLAAQRRKKLPGDITDATFENGILYIKNASAVLNGSILEVK